MRTVMKKWLAPAPRQTAPGAPCSGCSSTLPLYYDTLKPEDRATGLLGLLNAQQTATLSRLALEHVQVSDHLVCIRLRYVAYRRDTRD